MIDAYHADGFQSEQGRADEQGVFSRFTEQGSGGYGRQVGEYVPQDDAESDERDDVGQLREGRQQLEVSDQDNGHQR